MPSIARASRKHWISTSLQHIHEFALRYLPWGTREDDAITLSNTHTAESDSTNLSDNSLFGDDIDDEASMVKNARTQTYISTHRPGRGAPHPNVVWSEETRYKVSHRLNTLSDKFVKLDVALNKIRGKSRPRSNFFLLPLIRAGDVLSVIIRYIHAGRTHSVESVEKRDSYASWRDGSYHTIMIMLDEIDTELEGISEDIYNYRHPKGISGTIPHLAHHFTTNAKTDLSIRPICFDIPSLHDSSLLESDNDSLLDRLFHRAMINSEYFVIILRGPSSVNTSIISRIASDYLRHSPDLQVFWVDIQALGLVRDHCITHFDWVLGQIGVELLEVSDLLGFLSKADHGPAFVEAMLQTMNKKTKKK